MTLSAAAVGGQWFIHSQDKEVGALVFAATVNVRQVASTLTSYAKYGPSITSLKVLGLLVVFAGIFYESISGLLDNASTCQYGALRFLSFPVQMLETSFKMMPVTVWGKIGSGKLCTATDWVIVGGVTGGVTEFLTSGPISSSEDSSGMHGRMVLRHG